MTEAELISQMKNGDEAAFTQLINRHYTQIYQLCHRFLANAMDSEEAAQDVFIQFHRHINRYQPNAQLSTYLYRLAVNRSLNGLRTRKRKRLFSFHQIQNDQEWEGNPNDRPDQKLEEAELARAVQKAIDALPENQRTAVILRRYQELSYEEIADVMNCSVSAVESRLHRAKQALRKKLKYLKE